MKFYSIQKQVIDYIGQLAKIKPGSEDSDILKAKRSELNDIIAKLDDLEQEQKDLLYNIIKQGLDIKLENMFGNEPLVDKIKLEYIDKLSPARRDTFTTEYKKILVYCKIAHVFENNGIAQEHAIKLTILFGNFINAIKTLSAFANQNKKGGGLQGDGAFVHEACLFDLPDNKPDDITWQVAKKLLTDPANFADAELRKIINCINDVASYYNDDKDFICFDNDKLLEDDDIFKIEKYKNLKTNSDTKIERRFKASYLSLTTNSLDAKIKLVAQEIKDLRNAIKKVKSQDVQAGTDQASKREHILKTLNVQLNTVLELYAVCHKQKGLSFENILKDKTALSGVYKKYLLSTSPELKLLVQYGMNQQNIAKFQSLDRSNAGSQIPYLLVTHDDYPEYYMRKLDVVNNSQDAAKAACLGKITKCCQSIGAFGNDCAIHGLTSPNGGFYVLCRKKSKDGDIDLTNDDIVAQSWVWRSTDNGLVMDSVEFNKGFAGDNTEQVLEDLYNSTARELGDKHDMPLVYLGYAGNGDTPNGLGFKINGLIGMPRDYSGYRDSKQQKILTAKIAPYIVQANGLNDQQRDKKTSQILNDKLSTIELKNLHKDVFFQILAQYLSEDKENIKCNKIYDCLSGENHDKLKEYINLNEQLLKDLSVRRRRGRHIKDTNVCENIKQLLQSGACGTLIDNSGNNMLHNVTHDFDIFKTVAEHIPVEQFNIMVRSKNNEGDCPLRKTLEDTEFFEYIISKMPQQELFEIYKENDLGRTMLYCAAHAPGTFKAMLLSLPKEKQLKLIKIKCDDYERKSLLSLIANEPELLQMVIDLYPDNEITNNILRNEGDCLNLLYYAAGNYSSLKILLEKFTEQQQTELIKSRYLCAKDNLNQQKTDNGTILLSGAAQDLESMKYILGFYSEDERLTVISEEVESDFSTKRKILFHQLIKNTESYDAIFSMLPKNDHIMALKITDSAGCSLFHNLTCYGKVIEHILCNYNPQQQLDLLVSKDDNGVGLLQKIAKESPASLIKFLDKLPPEQIKDFLESKVNSFFYEKSLINSIVSNEIEDSFSYICNLYSPKECQDLIKRNNILSGYIPDKLLPIIIRQFDQHARPDVLETVFNRSSNLDLRPEIVIELLRLLSDEDKFKVLANYKCNFVVTISKKPQYISEFMALLPANRTIEFTKTRFCLTYILKYSEYFTNVIKSYTSDEVIALLTEELRWGNTRLKMLIEQPDSLFKALSLIDKSSLKSLLTKKVYGCSYLKMTAEKNIDSLILMLQLLPAQDRRQLLDAEKIGDDTMLEYVNKTYPDRYHEIIGLIDSIDTPLVQVVSFRDSEAEHMPEQDVTVTSCSPNKQ